MDKIELGAHARMIIDNKAYSIIFDMVQQNYMSAWASTQPGQEKLRDTLYNTSVALTDVRKQIEALAVAGDNATFTKESEDR